MSHKQQISFFFPLASQKILRSCREGVDEKTAFLCLRSRFLIVKKSQICIWVFSISDWCFWVATGLILSNKVFIQNNTLAEEHYFGELWVGIYIIWKFTNWFFFSFTSIIELDLIKKISSDFFHLGPKRTVIFVGEVSIELFCVLILALESW